MTLNDGSDLVSVIIPTHGRPQYIERAILSVARQIYKNIEIIIVDDNGCGTEYQIITQEIIEKIQKNYPVKYIVHEKNKGGAIARNTGIELALGQYVTFLDDDDEYLKEKISLQLSSMKACRSEVSLCNAIYCNIKGETIKYEGRAIGKNLRDFLLSGNALTPMIMVKRNLLISAGCFDSAPRYQDHLLMLKLLSATQFECCIVEKKLYKCYRHDGGRISNNDKAKCAMEVKHKAEQEHVSVLNTKDQQAFYHRQSRESIRFMIRDSGLLYFTTYGVMIILKSRNFNQFKLSVKHILKTILNRYQ